MEQLEEWPDEADEGRVSAEEGILRVSFGGKSGTGLYLVFRRLGRVR